MPNFPDVQQSKKSGKGSTISSKNKDWVFESPIVVKHCTMQCTSVHLCTNTILSRSSAANVDQSCKNDRHFDTSYILVSWQLHHHFQQQQQQRQEKHRQHHDQNLPQWSQYGHSEIEFTIPHVNDYGTSIAIFLGLNITLW